MDLKSITVRGVESRAHEQLVELRDYERRFIGAILSDAIQMYWSTVFDDAEDA